MQGIYKITNLINNKIYIGKTNDSNRRWKDHQRLALYNVFPYSLLLIVKANL